MKRIKEMQVFDKPREKMNKKGSRALSDIELLAVLLGSGIKGKDVFNLAGDILKIARSDFNSLNIDNLTKIDGIGLAKATQISAAIEFSRRFLIKEEVKIMSSDDILKLTDDLKSKKQEYFIVITLDGAHNLIQKRVVFIGTLNRTLIHPREIFADALTDRAADIILVHNHPSGSLEPSKEDLNVTKQLEDAGKILGINILDHIIVSKSGYYSFQENKMLNSIDVLKKWENNNINKLKKINKNTAPKKLIEEISEDLLNCFENIKLIDKYDIYQQLMDYWSETMHDDVYIIMENDWKADINEIKDSKGKIKKGEWNSELLPKEIVIGKYFLQDKEKIDELNIKKENIKRYIEEFEEENGSEGGLLEEVKSSDGKIKKKNVELRIKEIKTDAEFVDELEVLLKYLKLIAKESAINAEIKKAEYELDEKLLNKYKELNEDETKTLVVEDKWFSAIKMRIIEEKEKVSQKLAQRIQELALRYENKLSVLEKNTIKLEQKVKSHLKEMGFEV
jgi:DNA repair protein RadC